MGEHRDEIVVVAVVGDRRPVEQHHVAVVDPDGGRQHAAHDAVARAQPLHPDRLLPTRGVVRRRPFGQWPLGQLHLAPRVAALRSIEPPHPDRDTELPPGVEGHHAVAGPGGADAEVPAVGRRLLAVTQERERSLVGLQPVPEPAPRLVQHGQVIVTPGVVRAEGRQELGAAGGQLVVLPGPGPGGGGERPQQLLVLLGAGNEAGAELAHDRGEQGMIGWGGVEIVEVAGPVEGIAHGREHDGIIGMGLRHRRQHLEAPLHRQPPVVDHEGQGHGGRRLIGLGPQQRLERIPGLVGSAALGSRLGHAPHDRSDVVAAQHRSPEGGLRGGGGTTGG